jgi:hypothetical protein
MTDHEGTTGGWPVSIGSARGAGHLATGQPNQDAAARRDVTGSGDPVIVAIADGHGHSRHFRSGSGSLLAVDTACRVAAALAAGLARRPGLSHAEVTAAARAELAPALVRDWRAAVAGHLAEHPFSPEEQSRLDALGDDPEIPYGATLLVVTIMAHWLICAQIGDGDMLAIRPDGQSFGPVSPGEKLGGERTRSLCQPDALDAFRVGVHDLATRPLVAVLLATDGYGNSQTADPWQPGVGRDLARFAAEHDHGWFERQVPGWAERCASADGSGDDTTIALLVHPDPAAAAAAARQAAGSAGADRSTAETLPAGFPPGAGQPGAGPAQTVPVATVEIEVTGPGAHPDTLRIEAVPGDEAPAGPLLAGRLPAGPVPADTALAGRAPAGPVPARPARAAPAPGDGAPGDPAATLEQTLPIRKSPPSGPRGARPPGSPAPPAPGPDTERAGFPTGPPRPPRAQPAGTGPRGPGPQEPRSPGPLGNGLRPPRPGITSSRRAVVMIAAVIALAVVAAIVVVLLALRPAARPAPPGPSRHVPPASQSAAAAGPQPSQGRKAGRAARHQHEGDG